MAGSPTSPATLLGVGIADEDEHEIAHILDSTGYRVVTVGSYGSATEPEKCRPREYIDRAVRFARGRKGGVAGVFGTEDYPPSFLAPAIAERLGLPTAPLAAVARCEHKAWSRTLQRALVPRAVPRFAFVDPGTPGEPPLPFPFWLKPVKSTLSVLGFRVADRDSYRQAVAAIRRDLPPFVKPFNAMISGLSAPAGLEHVDGCWAVAEELLSGAQCTLEGYVYDGRVEVLGVVDSIRFPNRVSFKHFVYPSRLPGCAQRAMAGIARRLMPGLGFDHGLFNIEFFWDPRRGSPKIIEVNSRFSPQFADLFEKVDGFNTYRLVLDLALGRRPDHGKGAGRHRVAGSFVLRHFSDRYVSRVPAADDLARVLAREPDARIRIRATAGAWLSSWPQDSYSFRYGLIHVGGRDLAEMQAKVAGIAPRLGFRFTADRKSS